MGGTTSLSPLVAARAHNAFTPPPFCPLQFCPLQFCPLQFCPVRYFVSTGTSRYHPPAEAVESSRTQWNSVDLSGSLPFWASLRAIFLSVHC
eukprot:4160054-Prymnesium_polylepis.3